MAGQQAKILELQVNLACNRNCEACSKYFDCTSPLKRKIVESPFFIRAAKRMEHVKYKIAVLSGKGGVGKSTVCCNLACAFHLMGAKVGVLDSDFYGPSQGTLFGIMGESLYMTHAGIVPVVDKLGIKVATVASTLGDTEATTWLADQISWAFYQFIGGAEWGELDFLIIDLPPGTGEETLNVLRTVQDLAGGLIVTVPSEMSQVVVGRGITLCNKAKARIFGIVENMGTFVCPNCGVNIDMFLKGGGRMIAEKRDVHFLGTIPLDYKISEASDVGTPFVLRYPDSEPAKAFYDIVKDIAKQLNFPWDEELLRRNIKKYKAQLI
jgi:ATP-binding protein involved in chromosome partitioning